MESYRDRRAWKRAMQSVVASEVVIRALPACARYRPADQLQRSADASPTNIAEGYGRLHRGDDLHHPSSAQSSVKELETHLLIAVLRGRLRRDQIREAEALCDSVARPLDDLIASLGG